jgi:cation transport regulator
MTQYQTNADLPQDVKEHLPSHAQEIYRETFNSAWNEYKDKNDREGTAHAVAWSAVENEYKKNNNDQWVRKDE